MSTENKPGNDAAPLKILDVGCGFDRYPNAVTLDSNKKAKPDILHNIELYPWPVKDGEFDLVYCSHCLEHLLDPKKAIEEIHRITKPGGKIIILTPHFSSRIAWSDIEHKHAFSINIFNLYGKDFVKIGVRPVEFSLDKVVLHWNPGYMYAKNPAVPPPLWLKKYTPFIKLFDYIISGLANLSPLFCERFWCYYVGGMGEIRFEATVIKNS